MGIFQRLTGAGSDKRRTITERDQEQNIVVEECFCPNGHSLITQQAVFASYPGITLALKNEQQSGLLSLSPIIGDRSRSFFNF
ncbi:MAG: hypothetical protein C0621_03765 [Desulfuromonas sp.]|nr:MAG: hypothetical protein C0621_03765 [Desulfuromonas sp.]